MIANTYDNLNRLRSIDKPGSEPDITNDYDNLRLVKAIDASRHVRWDYDALGRLTSEYQSELNATVSRQYDPGNHWTKLIWPDTGFWVQYDINDAGESTAVRETGASSGPGQLATFTFDDVGRPTNLYRGSGGHTGLGYDASSRLSSLAHDATAGGGATNQFFGFSYNPAGQITSRTVNNPAYMWAASGAYSDSYVVNGLNQYTSARGFTISHDARGNTTNDGTKSYTYDSSNRLTSASNGASVVYDPTGRLLSISLSGTTTKFLYDGTRLIGEYNGSGALLRRYVHGPGTDQPIVWYEGSGTGSRNWLYPDERGSIIGIEGPTAPGGFKINRYDEYGLGDAGNLGRFSYTGQTWLSEVGLHYYKARMYNPAIGRFMQTDPIGTQDQINLYAYVRNDPVNATDPSGLCDSGFCKWLGNLFFGPPTKKQRAADAPPMFGSDAAMDADTEQLIYDQASQRMTEIAEATEVASFFIGPSGEARAGATAGTMVARRLMGFVDDIAEAIAKRCGCFVAGTQVWTPSGLKPIESIAIGDDVIAWDEMTKTTSAHKVTTLIRPDPKAVYRITARSLDGKIDTFEATDDHPWFIETRGWLTTLELRRDMRIETSDDRGLTVLEVAATDRIERTYNLEVEGLHTFLVGPDGAVVHNDWCRGGFKTIEDSLKYHFGKHGAELGSKDIAQYQRQAEAFAQNLRGARKFSVDGPTDGVTRYVKDGKFIDISPDGSIVSFGRQ